jgi:hypothetical protein
LIALLEADVAPALQLLLWCLCAGRLVLVLLVLPHSFAVVAVQDSQVKFATNLYLPHPPLPLSLSLFLAGSKSLVFACSCCEHCVCAFVISEVQCSEVWFCSIRDEASCS